MFFVSEEFLRKYELGEEIVQTIDEAVGKGENLFGDYQSKADWKLEQGNKKGKGNNG